MSSFDGMGWIYCGVEPKEEGGVHFCLGDKTPNSFAQLCLLLQFVLEVHYCAVSRHSLYHYSVVTETACLHSL